MHIIDDSFGMRETLMLKYLPEMEAAIVSRIECLSLAPVQHRKS